MYQVSKGQDKVNSHHLSKELDSKILRHFFTNRVANDWNHLYQASSFLKKIVISKLYFHLILYI